MSRLKKDSEDTLECTFLASATIAMITCMVRPDYNLPLMSFAFLQYKKNVINYF